MQVNIENIKQLFCVKCVKKYTIGPHKLFYLNITEVSYNAACDYLAANNMTMLLNIYSKLILSECSCEYTYKYISANSCILLCDNHGGNFKFHYISCTNCLHYFCKLHSMKNLKPICDMQTKVPEHICNKSDMKLLLNEYYLHDDDELIKNIFADV